MAVAAIVVSTLVQFMNRCPLAHCAPISPAFGTRSFRILEAAANGPQSGSGFSFCCRPFWDSRIDNLDCVCSASILLQVVANLFYNNPIFTDEVPGRPQQLDDALIVVNFVVLAVIFGLFIFTLVENRFKAVAIGTLSKKVTQMVISMQREIAFHHEAFVPCLVKAMNEPPSSLEVGIRVSHEVHGPGTIKDMRGKSVAVTFDGGSMHYYAMDSALAKLKIIGIDPSHLRTDSVGVGQLRYAMTECLRGKAVARSFAAIEALFWVLKAVDNLTEDEEDVPVDRISMAVVHAHANAYVSCITVAQRLHSCKQTQLKITADSLYVLVHLPKCAWS